MTSHFFGFPLTEGSTGRSLSSNHNISARGRTDEGCEAIAFGHSFPITLGFLEHPRISGHGEGEVASPARPAGHAALVGTLRSLHCELEAPRAGRLCFGEE